MLVLAYGVRGVAGFGSGLIAVPLLALLWPLTFVVPLVLLLDFTASLLVGGAARRRLDWREIAMLLPTSLTGVVAGTVLLVSLPRQPLLVVLGLFVIAFGLRSLLRLHGDRPVSRLWALPAGLLGGTVSALFGTGGPPYVIYLSHRIRDLPRLQATFAGLFMIEGVTRIATFAAAGLFAGGNFALAYAAALPLTLTSLFAGMRLSRRVPQARVPELIGSLLLVSGASLLWKAAAG